MFEICSTFVINTGQFDFFVYKYKCNVNNFVMRQFSYENQKIPEATILYKLEVFAIKLKRLQ